MKEEIKLAIQSIEPSYETTSSYRYPLPNEITLYSDSSAYIVDLNLKENVLKAEVWQGGECIELNEQDIDFIYTYLNDLLEEEIELTKRYYEEERYEEQTTYFIR